MAKGVLLTTKGALLMQFNANPGMLSRWAPMSDESLAAVIDRIRFWKPDVFWSNFVKAVHDRLNRDIADGGTEPKKGIEVKNGKGMVWQLPGDKFLHAEKEQKTLQFGREAVAQSRRNVTEAVGKEQLDYTALAAVWEWVPQSTPAGAAQIKKVTDRLLDPATDE